jgi:hypothetical protein
LAATPAVISSGWHQLLKLNMLLRIEQFIVLFFLDKGLQNPNSLCSWSKKLPTVGLPSEFGKLLLQCVTK